ncbi:MAG TPA: diaminopimelate epimerase [Thermoanaerobaculia bacterium]|nr:diaminopimelate epimerase [Thermoanaerobaculia bacterium]
MRPPVEYWRVSGAGNDFLALVEPPAAPAAAAIRAWCRRGLSLGADGLFTLRPGEPVAMTYYNADGEPAELCLNATRCAAQLAFELGWAGDEVRLATGAGEVLARRLEGDEVELELPPPSEPVAPVRLDVDGSAVDAWRVRVGVPHLVVAWHQSLARCPVAELGPRLRAHPELGPEGANVDFVRYRDRGRIELRTWERGVEAETLACGTGVLAAALGGLATLQLDLPVTATTRGGFDLTVRGEAREGVVRRWTLAGDARLLARGTLFAAADRVPPPPAW